MSRTATPAEAKWIREAQEVLSRKPATIALFGCESGLVALRAAPDGALPMTAGGGIRGNSVDSSQGLATLTRDCDGGAW